MGSAHINPPPPPPLHSGVIILSQPQLGVNIGACARAMLNCGFHRLRLVRPRPRWSRKDAKAMACAADFIIDTAQEYTNTQEALDDLHSTLATTSRIRNQNKPTLDIHQTARKLAQHTQQGHSCGVLFGCESSGLSNHEINLCDAIVHIPLHPHFPSLNLAQAVLLVCYAWHDALPIAAMPNPPTQTTEPATKKALNALFQHGQTSLEQSGFLHNPLRKDVTLMRLRNLLLRMRPNAAEVRLLRGVIQSLFDHQKSP
ncbi:MAG: RNA methyltransferase [Alphaproteobacteria bacterium GM202ARS2]|nr:RNA methyltransferase [Alphaproteobacteria bacterium GM202ARS2]